MRLLLFIALTLTFSFQSFSQSSSLYVVSKDTITIGNFKLINTDTVKYKKGWYDRIELGEFKKIKLRYKKEPQTGDFETRWFKFDIGFANYIDETNYKLSTHLTNPMMGLSLSKDKMKLRNSKSINLNIWFVQQKVKLTQNAKWHLKYGLGLELYNFRFEKSIDFRNDTSMYISLNKNHYEKNKVALGYLSIPLVLTHKYKFKKTKDMSIGGGLTFGYLVSAKNKQVDAIYGKKKYNSDFNFNDYRVSGTVEVGFGSLVFYGSTTLTNLLDRTITNQSFFPFSFGIKL